MSKKIHWLCKIFGHKMYHHKSGDITKPTHCGRRGCCHKGEGITWPREPEMPECKPPKEE